MRRLEDILRYSRRTGEAGLILLTPTTCQEDGTKISKKRLSLEVKFCP
jgi:hypothetical protein